MSQPSKLKICVLSLVISLLGYLTSSAFAQDKIDFNLQIRPILNAHCISCHGPDESDRQAGLRLDTYEDATDYAIVPGEPDESDVIDRITTDDEDLRMPPAEHGDALKPEEIELLKTWIEQGANYQTHWAFTPIGKPAIPKIQSDIKNGPAKAHNPIDNFILRKLHQSGLKQNAPAKPRELIRRVSLDLTGAPPQFHQPPVQSAIKSYLDAPNQSNFESVVDRLLDSPSYAEHWAAVWMDIARYADTCGYSGDERREIWPWRDWLIRSLQSGKSYKELSTEMLAGDMLPGATQDQILATAFHRNTLSNNEGGTNDEEFRTIAVKDRLSTTLNAWMGLTVRCAECHSHKYDPISQTEYYQLLDFFNQTADSDHRDDRPKLAVPQSRDPGELERLNEQIAAVKKKAADAPKLWNVWRPEKMESRNGTEFKLLDDDSILATGKLPNKEEYAFTFSAEAGTSFNAIKLEALPHLEHNGKLGRVPDGAFILTQIRMVMSSSDSDDEQTLPWKSATASLHQKKQHPKLAIRPKVKLGTAEGWSAKHPTEGYKNRQEAIFELAEPVTLDESATFKIYMLFDSTWIRLNLGCVRISHCRVDDAVAKYDRDELDPANRELVRLLESLNRPVRVPVMKQRKKRRDTYVNLRGNFQSKGEKVSAKFPEAFSVETEYPLNRLGLTQWLFDEDNPLTARVAVNRYWARLMGIGLVETEEDFGTQGSPASHPELLDHLAHHFRDTDWDTRKLLKSIVMSATYQQSQHASKQVLQADPRNRLLARGPRVRLSAEVVRDQALAVSGLLSRKMYGKPVFPPNPIKRVVNAFTGGLTWEESTAEDRYRRAIYTFLKRSAPHPLFETFDVSTRDVCSMRRLHTNTPLQSFMTLNDITFIEAARALADQMLDHDKTQSNIQAQIRFGLEQALYTSASEQQIKVLTSVYEKNLNRFENDISGAVQFLGQPNDDLKTLDTDAKTKIAKRAALTLVANVILNLDSFLNN